MQLLGQEMVRQHRGDDDGQRAERGDEHRGGEGVRGEIRNLPDDHREHARPPEGLAEVAVPAAARAYPARRAARQLQPFLLDDEARADGQRRAHGQEQPDPRVAAAGRVHGGVDEAVAVQPWYLGRLPRDRVARRHLFLEDRRPGAPRDAG